MPLSNILDVFKQDRITKVCHVYIAIRTLAQFCQARNAKKCKGGKTWRNKMEDDNASAPSQPQLLFFRLFFIGNVNVINKLGTPLGWYWERNMFIFIFLYFNSDGALFFFCYIYVFQHFNSHNMAISILYGVVIKSSLVTALEVKVL